MSMLLKCLKQDMEVLLESLSGQTSLDVSYNSISDMGASEISDYLKVWLNVLSKCEYIIYLL